MTKVSSHLPRPPVLVAVRLADARGTNAASTLRDVAAVFRRFGLTPAVELVLEAGEPPPAPTTGLDVAVWGLRAHIHELVQEREALDSGPADPTVEDPPARRMAYLRSLHARRLVYALPADAAELGSAARARELGRRLDGVAARFQGQGFRLGLALAPHAVERVDSLVALATQITSPAFFLELRSEDLPDLLSDGWGRALAPLVRQLRVEVASEAGGQTTAVLSGLPQASGALPLLEALVLVPSGSATTAALQETLQKLLARNCVQGLSPRPVLP
ncbi:MAG TPA: hypothetical protein VNB06_15575 [Thermoanaerobaculia bacterium]|nr:hypothetical protein [Thermoanaerobaculia bacterium]